ncbi:cell envelope biogenesis protein TolA [Pseudoprimorskyibacter insulae]|uniref:Cell division and transport-associated protein TolA n=1 Tax=Pseudoprimorskyibacter insulae TaxID=1695997 RepID=A0A2R8AVB7_9RHOB|nr:cell envelope biogenesis protein TolA [Pseudoprimorskyibacter insulae]SPF79978.1 hypothetical protein PRI8871_01780 [Pseudoprimorskyibacter insulae]
MHIGHYISGAGHIGLIGWLLLGPLFTAEPLPMNVTPVSIVTAEEFAAIVQQTEPPQAETEIAAPTVPDAPETPVQPTPEPEPAPTPVPTPPEPDRPATPEPEPQPAPEPDPEPVPEAEPVPVPEPQPEPEPDPVPEPPAPEPVPQVLAPKDSPRPQARPAPRVAARPEEAPEPDAVIALEKQDAARPDETAEQVQDSPEKTAPQEASTQIATEQTPEGQQLAPVTSARPKARPPSARPTETAEASKADPAKDALNAALEKAMSGNAPQAETRTGPPLTEGERDVLRLAVQDCWTVDVGSQAASVTVTLGMKMDRDGRVQSGSLKLLSSSGGSGAAAETAFQAARRAVLRCQRDGYELPIEKYDQWKDIEMTFDPATMRLR